MTKSIFTIVKNERFFIEKWHEYYSKHFESKDIYVLDHDTTDGSLDDLKCNIIRISNVTTFDHVWLREQVQNLQRELLKLYDIVVFAEVDEFIIPINDTLTDYLKDFYVSEDDYVTCTGVELLHSNAFYESGKILDVKRQMRFNPRFMNKTLITKVPLNYAKGFHEHDKPNKVDSGLILLHLHYFDYLQFMYRAYERLKLKHTFEAGLDGVQNKYLNLGTYHNDFWKSQNADCCIELPSVI